MHLAVELFEALKAFNDRIEFSEFFGERSELIPIFHDVGIGEQRADFCVPIGEGCELRHHGIR